MDKITVENNVLMSYFALDRAEYLINETVDNFFSAYNPDNKKDHWKIIEGFSRYRAFCEMVEQQLSEARKHLEQLGASRF